MVSSARLESDPQSAVGAALPERRWRWIDSTILAGYAAAVAVGIRWHEPWADESQAWLLARDNSWTGLMLHRLHYEGTPGLWHTLLWVLVRLHVSYPAMHWIAGGCALAGVALLLRFAPFPLGLRALLPFTFWIAYQDAVVARSYVLFAPAAFAAATLLRSTKRRPMMLALVLGLMANISLHGFIASVGFAAAAALDARQDERWAVSRWFAAATLLATFWVAAFAVMFPAPDTNFGGARNVERTAAKLDGIFGHPAPAVATAPAGQLQPLTPVRPHRTHAQAAWHSAAHVLSLLTWPLSAIPFLGLTLCAAVIVGAFFARRARWLLPWVLMVAVLTSISLRPRHAGMLAVAFIAALWMVWPERLPATGLRLWLHRFTLILLAAVCLEQIAWTLHAVRADVRGPYSGDQSAARFLASQAAGKRVAGFGYDSVGPAAWFSGPIYVNQPHAYWIWSSRAPIDAEAPAVVATHPDFIVYGGANVDPRQGELIDDWYRNDEPDVPLGDTYGVLAYAESHGYRETHRFCGHAWMRNGYSEELCQVILEPK
ncbi:MAG TPA: hypothetical protein VME68_00600 [Acidobacteriaceae bacterium]|nr:hypothetical protein [Acidobacteriaceae bacterium]